MTGGVNCSIGCTFFARQPFRERTRRLAQFVQPRVMDWIAQDEVRQAIFILEQAQEMVDAGEVGIRDKMRASLHPARPFTIPPAAQKCGEVFKLCREGSDLWVKGHAKQC